MTFYRHSSSYPVHFCYGDDDNDDDGWQILFTGWLTNKSVLSLISSWDNFQSI